MTTITLTDELIDHLIGARNRITDRTDEFIDYRAVDHIDAVLSDIPVGERPDVDALLGRITKRVVMVQHIDGTIEMDSRIAYTDQRVADVDPLAEATMQKYNAYCAELDDDEIALMNARCNETARQDDYDSSTEGHW